MYMLKPSLDLQVTKSEAEITLLTISVQKGSINVAGHSPPLVNAVGV